MAGALRHQIPVLDHGFLALVDVMPRLVPGPQPGVQSTPPTADADTTPGADGTTDDTTDPGQGICPVAVGTDGNGAVDCSPDPSACYEAAAGDAAPLATDAAGDGSAATAGETLPVTGGVAGALALLGALCIALGAALLEGQRRLVARGRLTPLRRRL